MRTLLLAVLFGFLFLAGLGTPGLLDYDEACYAEVAREMYTSGEYLTPTLNGEPFFEKPPFLYWTQVAGFHLFGPGPLGARVFNTAAAVSLVLALFLFARRPLGHRGAFLSALILGTSLEFVGLARIAFTDMFLALWLFLCLGCFHRSYEKCRAETTGGLSWFLSACFFSGLAMLTKGAVGIVLPGTAIFLFLLIQRRLRFLFHPPRFIPGLVLLLGVGLSWYLLLGLTHTGGFSFMKELFWEHHVGRFSRPMQGHSGPFYYYVPVIVLGFLPWSPFLLPALAGNGLARAEGECRRYLMLTGIFAAVTFLFFSAAATKLPNYIAPILPCTALLVSHAFLQSVHVPAPAGRLWKWAVRSSVSSLFLLSALWITAPLLLQMLPDWLGEKALKRPGLAEPLDLGWGPYLAAVALILAAAGGGLLFRKKRFLAASRVLAAGMFAFFLVVMFLLVPRLDAHFIAPLRNLSKEAVAAAPPGKRVVLLGIRRAPSVVFYGGRQTRYVSRKLGDQIAALFHGPGAEIGITVEAYLERIKGPGRLEVLDRKTGYVLFRCIPEEGMK